MPLRNGFARYNEDSEERQGTTVPVLPYGACGLTLRTVHDTPGLVDSARDALHSAVLLLGASCVVAIANISFTLAVVATAEVIASTFIIATFSVLFAVALLRSGYLCAVRKSGPHALAGSCPCCPDHVRVYNNIVALGMAFHIIAAVLEVVVWDWLGFVLHIVLVLAYLVVVGRSRAFIQYAEQDRTRSQQPHVTLGADQT